MYSSSEDESLEGSIPSCSYLPGKLKVGINTTPLPSPEEPEPVIVEMEPTGGEDEVLKDLKQARTTAKAKYTVLRKVILGQ